MCVKEILLEKLRVYTHGLRITDYSDCIEKCLFISLKVIIVSGKTHNIRNVWGFQSAVDVLHILFVINYCKLLGL